MARRGGAGRSRWRARATAAWLTPLLSLPLSAPAARSTAGMPTCTWFRFSPDFVRDRLAFCGYRPQSGGPDVQPSFYVSRDGGRSWTKAAATGLTYASGPVAVATPLLLSPRYAADQTLFVTTPDGLFSSTDRANRFQLVDELLDVGGQGNPAAFLAAPPPGLAAVLGDGPRLYAGYAGASSSALVDTTLRLHQPALGAPDNTLRFVVPAQVGEGSWGPLAFSYHRPDPTKPEQLTVYGCTPSLACAQPLFAFPGDQYLYWADTSPDGKAVFVGTLEDFDTVRLWRSVDGGRSFSRIASVDVLLASVNRTSGPPAEVDLALHPRLGNVVYLRVQGKRLEGRWAADAPPAAQLFRSTNGGATWTRVGFRKHPQQSGPTGTLPWEVSFTSEEPSLAVAHDGRIFATGLPPGSSLPVTFCSVDDGRHWFRGCPR